MTSIDTWDKFGNVDEEEKDKIKKQKEKKRSLEDYDSIESIIITYTCDTHRQRRNLIPKTKFKQKTPYHPMKSN